MKTALLTLLLLVSLTSSAQDRVIIEQNGKKYFSHVVEQGQTLYSLSKFYGVDVAAIEAANAGATTGLSVGQTLLIPVPDSFDPDRWENPVRMEAGFMIHRVKRKETLYSISKLYKTDINRLLEHNPGADVSLKPGDELKIPVTDIVEPPIEIAAPGPADGWKKHRVAPGETLYAISKAYGVDAEEIKKINGGLVSGLKAGEEINIPVRDEVFVAKTESIPSQIDLKDTVLLKDLYRVVVMLPFELKSAMNETANKEARLREIAVNFYQGSLAALDSLEAYGARLDVSYIDVSTEADARAAIQTDAVKQANLIIGPLPRKPLEIVSEYASKKGTHIVCPVPQSNKILLASPNLSKVIPSRDTEMKVLAQHVATKHKNDNIILINSMDVSDARMIQLFQKHFAKAAGLENDTIQKGYKELKASSKFVGELSAKLSSSKLNVLVVPAGDGSKSMIANLQTKLQLLSKEYQIRIFAVEEWLEYDFLDVSFKERVNLTVPRSGYVAYTSDDMLTFTKNFRDEFKSDVNDYVVLGFDVMLYYGRGLTSYGIGFPNEFGRMSNSGLLGHRFNYLKTGLDSGFENDFVYLLSQKDYYLVPVNGIR